MIFRIDQLLETRFMRKNNLEKLNRKNQKFKDYFTMKKKMIVEYADIIDSKYVNRLMLNKRNKMLVCSIGKLSNNNISGVIVYRKILSRSDKLRFVLFLIATHPEMRGMGYGTILMNNFCDYVKRENKRIEILLHSLKSSYNFYIKYGFKKIEKNNFLEKFEHIEEGEDFTIMKLIF